LERNQIPRYIIDASVAVKWFIEETDTPRAVMLKERFENGQVNLEAPSLLTYEVASALRFHPKIQPTLKQLHEAIEALEQMQIVREPNEDEWTMAFQFSLENSISIYDAAYLSLAANRSAKMVTSDTKFLTNLKSAGARQEFILLSNLTA
jgi:predicted nucleic acid-binding protein